MQHCTTCQYQNAEGSLICGNCGVPIHPGFKSVATDSAPKKTMVKKLLTFLSRVETQHLQSEAQTQNLDLSDYAGLGPTSNIERDVSLFTTGMSIRLRIDQYEIVVKQPETEVIMGRFGEMVSVPREVYPVNLSEYAGYAMGVSRVHASLRPNEQNQLEIMDLASSNGTFLNGYPLNPYEIYHVYHGDEVRLGHMRLNVFFIDAE